MIDMIKAVLDSLLRAVIRFWDNRFLRSDEVYYLRERNAEFLKFILDRIELNTAESEESKPEIDEQIPAGRPIETTIAHRRRLEQESFNEWNRLVQEAQNKKSAENKNKAIEELEKDLGVSN